MDADQLSSWVQTHKIPAAAVGGVALAGVFAVVGAVRNRKGSAAQAPNTGTYFVVPGSGGLDGFNTLPGSDTPYIPKLPDPQTGGGTTPAPAPAPAPSLFQAPVQQTPKVPATMNPLSLWSPPEPTGVPLALPQIDSSRIYSTITVANPVGYTDAQDAANPGYDPSLSDYATERPGGIERTLVGVTSGSGFQGFYTVDNTRLGTGPVRDESYRSSHPGERFDSYGRVVA